MWCPERKRRHFYYNLTNTQKCSIIICLLGTFLNGISCNYKSYKNVHSSINLLAVPSSSPSTVSPSLLFDKYPPTVSTSQPHSSEQLEDPINHSLENDYHSPSTSFTDNNIEDNVDIWKMEKRQDYLQSVQNNNVNYDKTINVQATPSSQYQQIESGIIQDRTGLVSSAVNSPVSSTTNLYPQVNRNSQSTDLLPAAERVFVRHSTRKKIQLPVYTTVYSSHKIIPDRPKQRPRQVVSGKRRRQRKRPALPGALGRRRRKSRRRQPLASNQYASQASTQLPGYAPAFISYGPIYGPPPGVRVHPSGSGNQIYGVQSAYVPIIHPNPMLAPPVGPPHPSMQVSPTDYQPPRNYPISPYHSSREQSYRGTPALTISLESPSNDYYSTQTVRPPLSRPSSMYGLQNYNRPQPTYGPPRPTRLYPVQSNPPVSYAPTLYGANHGYGGQTSSSQHRSPPMHFGSPMHNFGPPMSSHGQPPPFMDDEDRDQWAPPTGYNTYTYPHMVRGHDTSPQHLYGISSNKGSRSPNSLEYNYNNNYAPQEDYYSSTKSNNNNYKGYKPSSKQYYRNKYNQDSNKYNQDSNNHDDYYNKDNTDYRYSRNKGGNKYGKSRYNSDNDAFDPSYGSGGSSYSGSGSGKSAYWSGKDNSIFHFDDDFDQSYPSEKSRSTWDKNNYYKRKSTSGQNRDRYSSNNGDEDKNYNYKSDKTKYKITPSQSVAFEDIDVDKYSSGGSNNYNDKYKSRTEGTVTTNVASGSGRPAPSYDTQYNSPGMSKDPKKTDFFGYAGRSKKERIQMGYMQNESNKPTQYTTLPLTMDNHRTPKKHKSYPRLTYDSLIRRILPENDGPEFLTEESKIDTFKAGSEFTKMLKDHDGLRL